MHFALFTRHGPIPSSVITVPGSFPYHTTMTETKITGIAINSFTTLQHGEEAEPNLQTGLSLSWRGGRNKPANQALSLMERRRKQTCKPGSLSHGEEAETTLQTRLSLSWRGAGNKPGSLSSLSHGEEAETSLGTRLCPNSTWFRSFLLVRGWGLGMRLIVHWPPQWFYGTQLICKQQRWADT